MKSQNEDSTKVDAGRRKFTLDLQVEYQTRGAAFESLRRMLQG